MLEVLAVSAALRERLGLTDKLPPYTTLQKFSMRSQVVAIVPQWIGRMGQQTAESSGRRNSRWPMAQWDESGIPAERGYGRRWSVESFFSALKRTLGGVWSAHRPDQMLAEASFRVPAYALRR